MTIKGLRMTELNYRLVPTGWTQECKNPFCGDGSYGPAWSCFEIVDVDGDRFFHGTGPTGLFGLHVERLVADLETRMADFLRYEAAHGRTVIVAAPSDSDKSALIERAQQHTPEGPVVRLSDPRWAVHSTGSDAWRSIRRCGELQSLARLSAGRAYAGGLGLSTFGEPADYAGYVALGRIDGIGPEHVVASHQKGQVLTDEDAEYEPGVRLYFDAHRIIQDGLATRDGVHLLKVRDRLPLAPYMRAAIGVEEADPDGSVSAWTPRLFLERANSCFQRTLSHGA